jgi:general secretion pathway protein G
MKQVQSGFSMIELMISLAVIVLIMSFVGPRVMKFFSKGEEAAALNTLRQLETSISQYRMDVGHYPQNLEELVQKPEQVRNWKGPYAESSDLEDRWGQPFVYHLKPKGSKPAYELYSVGNPDDGKVIALHE